jgi:transposase
MVQRVREKFTCRAFESISQAPTPFHDLPRGFAGPRVLAMIVFEKYDLIRVHGDDMLAKSKTRMGRLWTYATTGRSRAVIRPPPCSSIPATGPGDHTELNLDGHTGILQADAYAGFTRSMLETVVQSPSPRPPAGPMADASSLCSPMSPPRRAASSPWSLRRRSKRSGASTPSSDDRLAARRDRVAPLVGT